MSEFNGLGVGLHNISRLSKAQTRSISAENFTGEKGKAGMATEGTGANAARELGQGWKVSPSIHIGPLPNGHAGRNCEGPGAIQHIWNTCVHPTWWRRLILRVYWDGEDTPSIETPIRRFLLQRLVRAVQHQQPADCRQSLPAASTRIGRCRFANRPASRWKI